MVSRCPTPGFLTGILFIPGILGIPSYVAVQCKHIIDKTRTTTIPFKHLFFQIFITYSFFEEMSPKEVMDMKKLEEIIRQRRKSKLQGMPVAAYQDVIVEMDYPAMKDDGILNIHRHS